MKQIVGVLLLFALCSCVEVGFRNPQPENGRILDEIPGEMIAFYTQQNKDSSNDDGGFKLTDLGEGFDNTGTLSDETVLKLWKGKYFLNQKEDSLWYVVMIVPVKNGAYETYKMDGGNENTVKTLKGITHVEEIYSNDGELEVVIINPDKSEFKKIVKSGAFEKIDIF
ncbi:MAG: hypothetical protein KDC58_00220 [Cyclobacteriaceae bacterium]|nr:hypothetical protein [Cyclobacteriaceae bacterium]